MRAKKSEKTARSDPFGASTESRRLKASLDDDDSSRGYHDF